MAPRVHKSIHQIVIFLVLIKIAFIFNKINKKLLKDIKFYKQTAILNENQINKKRTKTTENNIAIKNKAMNIVVIDNEPVFYQNTSPDLINKRSASLNNLGSTYTKLDQLFNENSKNENNKENYFNEISNFDTINSHLSNTVNASKQPTHSSVSSTDEEFNFINGKNNEFEKLQLENEQQLNSNKRDKIPLNRKSSFIIENPTTLIFKNPNDKQFYFNFNMENRGNLYKLNLFL